VLALIETARLSGRGIGWVDAQLLASTRLTGEAVLWTRDKPLADAAAELGVGAEV
jgi:predicted nucleic acid-binding protein